MSRLVPGRPSARALRRGGLGLVIGVLGGWVAGLLRAPRQSEPQPAERSSATP